eukprot:TRINITY_DN4708_c0_g1_i5.p1 TRINITY_DN4708_c0_g1~~TRINITY_DN4708_c0_g1_i5.p1  ORF type:complete len:859 (-),score=193.16 TRINITY_DN4708_c0_g1_i5:148-2724(-)
MCGMASMWSAFLLGATPLARAFGDHHTAAFLGTDSEQAARSARTAVSSFLLSVADADADAEFGSSGHALELQTVGSSKGPGTLSEYCSGAAEGAVEEGARVKAEWHGLGTEYPGTVEDIHKDGRVDVLYDDGFTENNVKPSRVHVDESAKKKTKPPKDDPACKLQDFVEEVKIKVDKAYKDVSRYIGYVSLAKKQEQEDDEVDEKDKVEEEQGGDVSKRGNETEASELEKLKRDLADADEEIKDLKIRVKSNQGAMLDDEFAEEHADTEEKVPASASAVEALILRYKMRLDRRKRKIRRLKEKLNKQEDQIEEVKKSVPKLEDLAKDVEELTRDVNDAKAKRDRLEKEGKLDGELRVILDDIFKQEEKLRKKVTTLVEMDEQARREQEEAERAAAERKQSEAEKKAAKKRAEAAKAKLLAAAKEVESDLEGVSKSTTKLETGVHPHGSKWWRYRYEHSFVEGIVMVIVSVLFMLWERAYKSYQLYIWSHSRSGLDTMNESTMLLDWFECLTGEMMVCMLVFLTVWILGHCGVFEVMPVLFKESENIHLPSTGAEYQEVAWEICVVLFFAILFYYLLVLSVVFATTEKLTLWAEMDSKPERKRSGDEGTRSRSSSLFAMGEDEAEFKKMKVYFATQIGNDDAIRETIQKTYGRVLNLQNFPFWVYLRLNVRSTVDHIYRFGFACWTAVIATFIVLTLLHYFLHLGFLRVMLFFGFVQAALLGAMAYWIVKINRLSQETQSSDVKPWAPQYCIDFNTEVWVIFGVHYSLFFLCYGAARMICQPWMWELHFWPVLGLTIFTALISLAFWKLLAPMLPTFAVALAMPPYMDPVNIALMVEATGLNKMGSQDYLRLGTTVARD